MSASKVVSAREVLSDFLNQGHLEYRVPGRVSDYDRADAMIRDLEAEGLAIVPAAALAALSRERDEARERAIALQRQLKHEPARIRKLVLDIVHSEVEAPREMPPELHLVPVEDVARAAIRATKQNIAGRVAHADWRLPVISREGGKQDQGDAE